MICDCQNSYHELHRKKSIKGAHDAQVKIVCLTDDKNFEKHFKIVEKIR